ncbi:hypothetical protein LTR08_005841 [Meristemomyces frigidus]|nr:hypothetical protein LTR08_005841 [Meristemomyces frigidus]
MNLLHNKLRNRLSPVRVDKLQFIYINERVLNRITRRNTDPYKLHDLEVKLLALGLGSEPICQDPRIALSAVLE